jgi:hypothetical protein
MDTTLKIARQYQNVEARSFHSDGYDERTVLGVLAQSILEARGNYDWVLLPDADEVLCLRQGGSPRQYLEAQRADVLTATGYCFVHSPDEPELDPGRSFVYQRRYGSRCLAYDKPVILRPSAPVELCPGKHSVVKKAACVDVQDGDLVLLHYEMADWENYLYRKNRRSLSENNIREGLCVKRFCRPVEVVAMHWRQAVGKAVDLTDELPVIRPAT